MDATQRFFARSAQSARKQKATKKNYEFSTRARHWHWYQVYRNRIALGLEKCRNPDGTCTRTDLEFDHVVPWLLGGKTHFGNATILCHGCNNAKRDNYGGKWAGMISLKEEERRAPEDQRWSLCWEIQPVPDAPPAPEPAEAKPTRRSTRARLRMTTKIDAGALKALRDQLEQGR